MVTEYIAYSVLHLYEVDMDVKHALDKFDFYIFPVVNPDGMSLDVFLPTTPLTQPRIRLQPNREPPVAQEPTETARQPLLWPRPQSQLGRPLEQHRRRRDPALPEHIPWRKSARRSRDEGVSEKTGIHPSPARHPTVYRLARFRAAGHVPYSPPTSPSAKTSCFPLQQHALTPSYPITAYSYACDKHLPLFSTTRWLGHELATAMTATHGTPYRAGAACELLPYRASGDSADWAFEVLGADHAYTVELRPGLRGRTGASATGFKLPEKQIRGTAEEAWAGVKRVLGFVHRY